MPTIRTLQRLLLAGALSLVTGLVSAGSPTPPSLDDNDDGIILMVALGLAVASSIDCTSDAPSLCSKGGGFRNFFATDQMAGGAQQEQGGQPLKLGVALQ